MSCNCCNCSLINGFYKCDINDYRIVDENDNLVKVILDHELSSDDEEIEVSVWWCVSEWRFCPFFRQKILEIS